MKKSPHYPIYCVCLALLITIGCASVTSPEKRVNAHETRIFVVRHGEAYKNLPFHSHMSKEKQDSLTPDGLKQARRAGKSLKDKNIVGVVASPTGRTRETARIIAQEVGLKGVFSEDPAFKSMKKGRTPAGDPVTWSWRKGQWKAGYDPRPHGGESLEDATKRAVQGVEVLIKKYPGKGVVIVTHSDICAGLAGQAENTSFSQRYEKHGVGLAAVVEITIGPKGIWKLRE
jgi:broad specificity phosphatase PhoE